MNSLVKSIGQFWNSSIGKKIVVALTGLAMVGFLLGHMVGNLLVFTGREGLNEYAEFLHTFGHHKGIWVARIGLLVSVILHIIATVSLVLHNRKSRNKSYSKDTTVRTGRSSRMMIISGVIILVFIVFHLLHLTVRIDPDLANIKDPTHPERHDTYGMVIKAFGSIPVSLFYIVAITLLCSHLSHGISSIFQTLGLRSRKTAVATKYISWATTAVIWIGFLVVPISIMFGLLGVKKDYDEAGSSAIEQPVVIKEKTAASE